MTPYQFDWMAGRVVFWDLDAIDDSIPLEEQVNDLKEDLAQVEYPTGLLLDIGWYPEFSRDGQLVVLVTRPHKFHQPIFRATARTIPELRAAVLEAARIAERQP